MVDWLITLHSYRVVPRIYIAFDVFVHTWLYFFILCILFLLIELYVLFYSFNFLWLWLIIIDSKRRVASLDEQSLI